MTDPLNCLKPEHGKPVHVHREDKSIHDLYNRISINYNEVGIMLALTWLQISAQHDKVNYIIPCSQCLRDVALQARDLADALEELARK